MKIYKLLLTMFFVLGLKAETIYKVNSIFNKTSWDYKRGTDIIKANSKLDSPIDFDRGYEKIYRIISYGGHKIGRLDGKQEDYVVSKEAFEMWLKDPNYGAKLKNKEIEELKINFTKTENDITPAYDLILKFLEKNNGRSPEKARFVKDKLQLRLGRKWYATKKARKDFKFDGYEPILVEINNKKELEFTYSFYDIDKWVDEFLGGDLKFIAIASSPALDIPIADTKLLWKTSGKQEGEIEQCETIKYDTRSIHTCEMLTIDVDEKGNIKISS